MRIIVLLSSPQSGVNAMHFVIALKNVTLVSNKKSILLEKFDFAVITVDDFCKNELITVMFKFLMKKTQDLFFSNRNNIQICLFKCSTISLYQWLNSSSFAFANPISNLGLGNGSCDTLLAWSKALRYSPKLSSRGSISFFKMLTSYLRKNRCCNFESQKWNTLNAKDFLLDPLLTQFIRLWDCPMSKMLW